MKNTTTHVTDDDIISIDENDAIISEAHGVMPLVTHSTAKFKDTRSQRRQIDQNIRITGGSVYVRLRQNGTARATHASLRGINGTSGTYHLRANDFHRIPAGDYRHRVLGRVTVPEGGEIESQVQFQGTII